MFYSQIIVFQELKGRVISQLSAYHDNIQLYFKFKLLSYLTFLVIVLYSIGLKFISHDSSDSKLCFAFSPCYLIKGVSLLDMPCALNVKDWLRISICFYIFLANFLLVSYILANFAPVKLKLTCNNDESHKEF